MQLWNHCFCVLEACWGIGCSNFSYEIVFSRASSLFLLRNRKRQQFHNYMESLPLGVVLLYTMTFRNI